MIHVSCQRPFTAGDETGFTGTIQKQNSRHYNGNIYNQHIQRRLGKSDQMSRACQLLSLTMIGLCFANSSPHGQTIIQQYYTDVLVFIGKKTSEMAKWRLSGSS
jgi:hypothetical protein